MARISQAQNVFEGELSPLAEGRTDIDRYKRGMRYLSNMVPCRTGPAISRSGSYFEGKCMDPVYASKLLPFEYNEVETLTLEFGHFKLRFHYEYNGIAANREAAVTVVSATSPLTFTAPTHDAIIGESVVFSGFPAEYNVNGVVAKVVNVAGSVITTDYNAAAVALAIPTAVMAVVYEIATPYHRDDVQNLRVVQLLNDCRLYCYKSDGSGDYRMYMLHRYNTFNWKINEIILADGPWLDINANTTVFTPTGGGSWVPDMTAATAPSGLAAASTEVVGHEAWRAFDSDIDSYWEANNSQEGWLEYTFDTGYVNAMPVFTSAVSGGMTISASSETVGSEAWRVSDGDASTDWLASSLLPQTWNIDLGGAQTIREYQIRASKLAPEKAPLSWTLEGSASGVGAWTVVDTRTGLTWASGEKKHFTVASPAAFRYYRLNIGAVTIVLTTVVHPAVGVKGQKGYIPAYTTTTRSANKASFATFNASYTSGKPRIVDGYTIFLGRYNKGADVLDHAPRIWYFEGWNGTTYDLLDSQQNYDAWNNFRSDYISIQNQEPYLKYRIRIKAVHAAGDQNPRIGKLVLSSPDAPNVNLRSNSTVGINDDKGFLSTDVGRLLRLRGSDAKWRVSTITAVSSAVDITVTFNSTDPPVGPQQIVFWRLGLWSDTTGWPICATYHQNRLFCGGASGYPDHIVGSVVGRHSLFRQVTTDDVVTDASAIVTRCNSKHMSRITWLKSAEDGLRIGTGKAEYVMSAPTEGGLNARNFEVAETTKRGSFLHEPATIDNDVVFLQKNGRALYAHTYIVSSTGAAIGQHKALLMSKLGAHLLYPPVVQTVYQQEPHSVIWGRRTDGSVVAMTYSNDDDIYGGHRHDFSGNVKDLCVVESPTDHQHGLWMVVMRQINGQAVHYIERVYRFWDFGATLDNDATFVDSALRYLGASPITTLYGLNHLEGQYLNVLADKVVYRGLGPVVNGSLTLDRAATYVVVGLPMVMEGEIIAPTTGAQNGDADAATKRPHQVVMRLWESEGGEVGRWDEDHGEVVWTPIEYSVPLTAEVPELTPKTCMTSVIVLPGGYGTLGTVRFRQTDPLPLNVVGVYPQSYVEDEP